MGLDMYLARKTEFGGYNQGKITAEVKNDKGEVIYETENNDQELGSTTITVEKGVAYWRKANAIHLWFIKQGEIDEDDEPIDDCRPIYIGKEELEQLLDKCKQVKAKAKMKWGLTKNGQGGLGENSEVEIYEPTKDEFGTVIELKATGEKTTYGKLTNGTFCKPISSEDLPREFGGENDYYEKTEVGLAQVWSFTDIIANADEIAEILPTQSGCFFGSTEYDKWYMDDIDNTIDYLTDILAEHEKMVEGGIKDYVISYEYTASW